MNKPITVGSLFSGIGGLDLAAHWAGFTTSWFVEKEPFCQKVLNKHWPDVPVYGDVFECHNLPFVDVICGGFPCQPFSVAGQQRGKEDERYLLPEMLRIINEVQPYAVLFENVPGFTSLNHGGEFKYLLKALAEMGFDAQWGHIRASDVGAPHRRERWFCVAYTQHDGHITPTFRGGDETAVHNITQGENSASELARIYSTGITPETTMGDSNSGRCEQYNPQEWELRIPNTGCSDLGNTECSGFSGQSRRRSGAQLANGHAQSGKRETQSRLGRAAHGLPSWMDFVGFPSRPGQQQFDYEPSRTAKINHETNARIKALGNAVVPQCAYPIFEALMEWFQEMDNV